MRIHVYNVLTKRIQKLFADMSSDCAAGDYHFQMTPKNLIIFKQLKHILFGWDISKRVQFQPKESPSTI